MRAALSSLAVTAERPPAHLSDVDRELRRGLRAKARQLGDPDGELDLLSAECAYEQWHRLLFARFLAENNLLIHPQFGAPVTLEDCEELADSLDEPDGWSVAGRFAAEILPGIFRLDDPCVQLRLAPEGRLALEGIVAGLPPSIFVGDDALGWAYQYWQKERKDAINRSELKIEGSTLGPVTQLFTEHYMVRFLLENTLGAWWVGHNPHSPLNDEWTYLRRDEAGNPVAGTFSGWPDAVSEVTVMDPSCGSGHFLVQAFDMLWRMRAESEGLSAVAAQDAVLADNLFGLELDPRCVQIAMFAVALQAWKAGGGWRELPVPQIACSGIPVRGAVIDWVSQAGADPVLEVAMRTLHNLFSSADTLGSLVDPGYAARQAEEMNVQTSFDDVEWAAVSPLLAKVLRSDKSADPAAAVLGSTALGVTRAVELLSRRYTLVCTNVPYLVRSKQGAILQSYLSSRYPTADADLATAFLCRCQDLVDEGGTDATVTPQNWLFLGTYERFRRRLLDRVQLNLLARIGLGATSTKSWDTLRVLTIETRCPVATDHVVHVVDAFSADDEARANEVAGAPVRGFEQSSQSRNPASIISTTTPVTATLMAEYATAPQGIKTGDDARFRQQFWEQAAIQDPWRLLQGTVSATSPWAGRDSVVRWEGKGDNLARPQGQAVWGRKGVAVSLMRNLPVALYDGDAFDSNVSALVPRKQEDLPAIWAFAESSDFNDAVRAIDPGLRIVNASLTRIPFDIDHWRAVAGERYPSGLPPASSPDPYEWVFDGRPERASSPLQAAVGRLLGYCWPAQDADDLDVLADPDGVVCIPSVRGEETAAQRLTELLARAYGTTWSPNRTLELIAKEGSKKTSLDSYLRDDFFKAHCQLFMSRPFVWQVWDGRKDGFSALLNYHGLNRSTLEKVAYSYLGDWIERQVAAVSDDVAGADERLSAARVLQKKLVLILDGESPYDIFVRWKSLAEQPMGWEPDLGDGVRLNIRPFVEAGILRSKFNVKWDKDRGKNPDGSDRLNGLHYTNAQKQAARGASA